MANTLTVVAGPPFGGKSRFVRSRLKGSEIWIDYTSLFAALAGQERDPETRRYPVRDTGDPRLAYTALVRVIAIERAAESGLSGYVTTSRREDISRLQDLASTDRLWIVDPGEDVVRDRMSAYYDGAVPGECEGAVAGWYRSVGR